MINNIKVTVITSLFKCERYLQGYFEAVEKIINKNECEFLLLHNAPTENELKIINSNIRNRKYFVHIVVEKREGLYSTWNRGIRMAKGKYCAIWNVDDIRFANSLVLQADILDKNSQCGLVVGDIIGTDHYGTEGYRYYSNKHKISKRNEIFKSCIITCFPMWRKSIHDDIGLFDEQFTCAGDFDLQIRIANNYEIEYIEKSLGIYLENVESKISFNKLHEIENNLIYLRYGAYEKVILYKITSTLCQYSKDYIFNDGAKLRNTFQKPFTRFHSIKGIFISLIKTPYYLLTDIYHIYK